MTFQLNLEIAAPPATVFAFVADFTTMPRWYSAVQRVERTGNTSGVGTRYGVHRQLPGGPARNEVETTSYDIGREVTVTSLSGPTPFVYRRTPTGWSPLWTTTCSATCTAPRTVASSSPAASRCSLQRSRSGSRARSR